MAATDPQSLLAQAKCYLCLGITMAEALQLALLADIANGGGGGGGAVQIYSTTDANPNTASITPADPSKGADFYQDPSITIYNRWSWSITNQTWVQTVSP